MRSSLQNLAIRLAVAGVLLAAPLCTRGEPPAVPQPVPTPWQIAGIRAAFGDNREPYVEPSGAVQREALKLCVNHGWGAALDAQEVAVYLNLEDRRAQLSAIRGLGQMGRDAERFSKELAVLLDSKSKEIREAASTALSQMGAAGAHVGEDIVPWLGKVRSHNAAVKALSEMGRAGLAFQQAISAVAMQGPPAPGAAPESAGTTLSRRLADLLDGDDHTMSIAAACALGQMGAAASPFAGNVVTLLHDDHGEVRAIAAETLGELGGGGAPFAGAVAALLEDGKPAVRAIVAGVLEKMDRAGTPVGKSFAVLLMHGDPAVRSLSVETLGRLPEGPEFAKQAAALLGDSSAKVRAAAARALGQMGRGLAFAPGLAGLLEDGNPKVRAAAEEALCRAGLDQAAAARNIVPLLDDGNRAARLAALEVLGAMGAKAAPFARSISWNLADADAKTRAVAEQALARINGPPGAAPAPASDAVPSAPTAKRTTSARVSPSVQEEPETPSLAELLANAKLLLSADAKEREAALSFLDACGNTTGDLDIQAALLSAVDQSPPEKIPELRAHLRLWSGGNALLQRTVTWLGRPDFDPLPKEGLAAEAIPETLTTFLLVWDPASKRQPLRDELVSRIEQMAKSFGNPPNAEAAAILGRLAAKLKNQPGCDSACQAIRKELPPDH